MEQIFIDKEGRHRKGVQKTCEFCSKEFLTRQDQPAKYCCIECSRLGSRKQVDCVCNLCAKKFSRQNSKLKKSKSGFVFCSRECKDEAQRIQNGFEEMWPSHFDKADGKHPEYYRRIYKEANGIDKLICMRCGYCEFECGVDIHHLDEDHKNNKKDNLISLCSPCHRALHKKLWNICATKLINYGSIITCCG